MPSTHSLNQIIQDFPQFSFVTADAFRWSAETQTIHYDPTAPDIQSFLLHELGHAILQHESYAKDIDLLRLERDAWQYATSQLAPRYSGTIDTDLIEDNLDTYREWLHARSLCPDCHMTGIQTNTGHYRCVACGSRWKANEARNCALRRHRLAK